jgi:hypothetical protein
MLQQCFARRRYGLSLGNRRFWQKAFDGVSLYIRLGGAPLTRPLLVLTKRDMWHVCCVCCECCDCAGLGTTARRWMCGPVACCCL